MLPAERTDTNHQELPYPANAVQSHESAIKILACSGSLDGGGSERQLVQFASLMDAQRFAVEVYLLNRRGPLLQQLPASMPVHAFSDSPHQSSRLPGMISLRQKKHLQSIAADRRIQVVYDRTFHMSLLTGAAFGKSMPRISVIVSPPSQDFLRAERKFRQLKWWLLRRSYAQASRTVCVSNEVAEDAARFYRLPLSQFSIVTNPIDWQRVRSLATETLSDDSPLSIPQAPRNSIHVAVIGRFTTEKGHASALEAIKCLKASSPSLNPILHFIGDGPLRGQLESMAQALSISDCVLFHGYQSNPYPILARCDLALVPSLYEGFPNVALEALALRTPLIMTDYGPTARDIIGAPKATSINFGERGTLVKLQEPEMIRQAIEHFSNHPTEWDKRSEQGRLWVENKHGIAQWLEVMSNMVMEIHNRHHDNRHA